MARLNIPERYRDALSSLRTLSEESVREIRSMLDSALPNVDGPEANSKASIDPDSIIKSLKTTRPEIAVSNFKEILEAILSLYIVRAQKDLSAELFVDQVCDAMERLEGDLRLPHEDRLNFAGKLLTLLNADVFALVTKAYDLATEDERLYCHARILTDLRPIFGPRIQDGPQGMVVLHTLKLDFHEQGNLKDHREFYVSLDSDDLSALRQIIDRAEQKARTLTSVLKNVRVFGLTKE